MSGAKAPVAGTLIKAANKETGGASLPHEPPYATGQLPHAHS